MGTTEWSPSVRPSVRQFKSSSLEPSWPVECATSWSLTHGGIMGMPMGMIMAPGVMRTPQTPQPLCRFTTNQVHWNRLGP